MVTGKNKQHQLLGLTGGIGAGKSAAAQILREAGIPVIDADQLAREIVEKGSPALTEIAAKFGAAALNADGTLNREYLRNVIFNDPVSKSDLEKITHPKIKALAQKRAQELFQKGHDLVIYEAPLLIEAGSTKNLAAVIGVAAEDSIRIQRICARDKITAESARKAIASQMPQAEKMGHCHYVIQNDGSLADLRREIQKLLAKLHHTL